jgi:hypothetical protein
MVGAFLPTLCILPLNIPSTVERSYKIKQIDFLCQGQRSNVRKTSLLAKVDQHVIEEQRFQRLGTSASRESLTCHSGLCDTSLSLNHAFNSFFYRIRKFVRK